MMLLTIQFLACFFYNYTLFLDVVILPDAWLLVQVPIQNPITITVS